LGPCPQCHLLHHPQSVECVLSKSCPRADDSSSHYSMTRWSRSRTSLRHDEPFASYGWHPLYWEHTGLVHQRNPRGYIDDHYRASISLARTAPRSRQHVSFPSSLSPSTVPTSPALSRTSRVPRIVTYIACFPHTSRVFPRMSRVFPRMSRVSHASRVCRHSTMSCTFLTPVIVRSCRFSPPIPLAYI